MSTTRIADALRVAATANVAEKIEEAANATGPVSKAAAGHLASEALNRAAQAPIVRAAIASVLPNPIAWYRSQALWGQFFAFIGALAVAAPQIAGIFPEWSDPILKWGGLIALLLGTYNAASGRITTTRPIAGTEAAKRVESAAR